MRILLVEDTRDIAELVIEYLSDHEVVWETTIAGGASRLDKEGNTFGAVILDMQLPDGFGTELAAIASWDSPTCMFTAAPSSAKLELGRMKGVESVQVFDKMDFKKLFDWITVIDNGKEAE